MNPKVVALGILALLALGGFGFFLTQKQSPLLTSDIGLINTPSKAVPSENLIDYQDSAGFSFSYPDDLSLNKNETDDSYSDLEVFSSKVSGSLKLRIIDSEYKSLDEWVSLNKGTERKVSLGNLKGWEITTNDRLLLGALDQGIFFSIEMPLIEKDYWQVVYQKILSSFSFQLPQAEGSVSSDEVSFEGEEVVE